MKSLFVILLAVFAAEAQLQRQRCTPKSQFMQYCNTCLCDDDGFLMGCTIMACESGVWNIDGSRNDQPTIVRDLKINKRSVSGHQSVWEKRCEPGKSFKYYCNTCTCNRAGRVGRCTKMLCDESIYNEDGTMKINDIDNDKCKAGEAYRPDGCNICICNEYGTRSICTSKRCSLNSIQTHSDKESKMWGPLYKQGNRCIPRQSFYSQCNQCVCSRNGRSALCTTSIC